MSSCWIVAQPLKVVLSGSLHTCVGPASTVHGAHGVSSLPVPYWSSLHGTGAHVHDGAPLHGAWDLLVHAEGPAHLWAGVAQPNHFATVFAFTFVDSDAACSASRALVFLLVGEHLWNPVSSQRHGAGACLPTRNLVFRQAEGPEVTSGHAGPPKQVFSASSPRPPPHAVQSAGATPSSL